MNIMLNKLLGYTSSALAVVVTLSSCYVKDPIYYVCEPQKTQIAITTDWSDRMDGLSIPDLYNISVGEQILNVDGTTVDNNTTEVEPGTYNIRVFHSTENITITGNVASVNSFSGSSTIIDPMPGWLFTGFKTIYVEKGELKTVVIPMQQQTRQLTLILTPKGSIKDEITSIEATLSGVTASWDFENNVPTGTAVNVAPIFTKQADGTWKATVRLLGISGSLQTLTTRMTLINNKQTEFTIQSNLSTQLSDFNALPDAKTPLLLRAEVTSPDTDDGADFECTITDWTENNNQGVAN